ncbi:MAG: acyltransferase family protein [Janthinobacterium lividum]
MNQLTYFRPLTGLRAVAAYLVFLHHFALPGLSKDTLPARLLNELHIGVTIFFVLSGFLITYRYQDKLLLARPEFKAYIVNRFARIFPTYFIFTCLTFAFIFYDESFTSHNGLVFFLNITLLRGFSGAFQFSGVGQGWSLTVEETFYLSAPFLFYALRRFSPRKYWLVLAAYVALFLGAGGVLTKIIHGHFLDFFPNFEFLLLGTFFGRVIEFTAGLALALFLRQRPAASSQLSRAGWFTYAGIAGIILVVFALALISETYHVRFGVNRPLGLLLNNVVLPCFILLLFYGLLHERTLASRVLAHPVADVLGKSSYSFYLIHMGLFHDMLIQWITPDSLAKYGTVFLLTVAGAIICYYGLEKPCNALIRRLAGTAASVA